MTEDAMEDDGALYIAYLHGRADEREHRAKDEGMIKEIRDALANCTQGDWQWRDRKQDRGPYLMPLLENEYDEEILHFGDDEQYYPSAGQPPNDADGLIILNATKWLRYLLGDPITQKGGE